MDADLSLIEISGADDSLLLQQEILNDDACNVYLSCSPLCSIRPKTSPRTSSKLGSQGAENSGPASSKGSFNKENVNASKSDTVKLSLDPQQMKRKKKGVYNLRKSLAWDRAFFTEEGVLDPEELSMISGNLVSIGGEKLSIIHEEESESLSEVPEGQDDSADLLALEEKLFKDLPTLAAKDTKAKTLLRTPLKHCGVAKNNVVQPSPKKTPKAKRSVLSVQDVNQSGSKFSTGARPTTSSLLKRTANVKATKVSNQETKARRLPFSRPEPNAISSTSKSSIPTGQLKRTQTPQSGISAQKNLRVKSSSNNPKAAGSTALVGPGRKSSTAKSNPPQAKRIVPSKNGQSKPADKTRSSTLKNHLEGVQDPTTMPAPRIQSERDDGSRTMGISLPQKIPPVAGPRENVQILIPSAKPSGLRMPSPSMGFFGQQAKGSASRNLSQRHTQSDHVPQPTSSNLRIPSSVKTLNELRPTYSNPKVSAVGNGIANENAQLNLRQGSSGSSSSTLNLRPDLHENKNSDVELHSVQKLKLNIKHNLRSEISSAQQDSESSLDDSSKQHEESAQSYEIEKRLQIRDEETLHCLQRMSCLTPREHGDGMVSHVSCEDRDMNHEEVDKSKLTSHVTLAMDKKESSKGRNIVDCQPTEVSLSLTSNTCCLSPQSKHPNVSGSGICNVLLRLQQTEPSEDFHECDLSKNSTVSVVPRNDTTSEKRRSQDLYGAEDKEHDEDAVGMRNSSKKLKIVEDGNNPFLDGNITMESSSAFPSVSALEGQFIKFNDGDGQTELSCTAVEDMQDVEKSLEANGLLQVRNFGSRLNISNTSCPEPHNLQATTSDTVDCTVEFCEEVKCKDQFTGSATNSKSPSYKIARDDFCAMEMNHRPTMSHMFSTVELENTYSVDNFVEVLNGKHCTQDVENISSTLQPWDNALLTCKPNVYEEPTVHVEPNHFASEGDILPQALSLCVSSKVEQSFNSSNMVVGSTGLEGNITIEMETFQAPLQKKDADPNGDDSIEDTESRQKQLGVDCLSDVCRKSVMSSSVDKTELSPTADQDFGFEECNENQDSFKVKNDLQPTKGMPAQDCSLRETLQEEMVNGCTNSELVQPNLCMKAEANKQVEDIACTLLNENKQIDMDIEVDVSAEMIWEKIQELQNVDHSRLSCSLDDDLCPPSSSTQRELSVPQIGEGSKVESNTLPADRVPTQQVTGYSTGEIHKSDRNQDAAIVKLPPDATPFSDEWLAAFEAAGEEILTIKSGKVQNSPPDKTLPEPGPWSPVKKKHIQAIGPFDCTKCTNGNINA